MTNATTAADVVDANAGAATRGLGVSQGTAGAVGGVSGSVGEHTFETRRTEDQVDVGTDEQIKASVARTTDHNAKALVEQNSDLVSINNKLGHIYADTVANIAKDALNRDRELFDRRVSLREKLDNAYLTSAAILMSNSVEQAKRLSVAADRHSEIAVNAQWNLDEQAPALIQLMRDLGSGGNVNTALLVELATALKNITAARATA